MILVPHSSPLTPCSWLAGSPCAPQVGFQKRTRHLFGLHTQLELVLAGVSLLLAALLLGCFVALAVQYQRGRRAHPVPSPPSCGDSGGGGPLRHSLGWRAEPPSPAFLSPPNLQPSGPLSKHLPFSDGLTAPWPGHVPPSPTDPSHSTCLTEACIRVAGKILETLDRGVSPCEDFYQFSCGGWIRRNPLPDGRSRWNTFNSLWDQNQAILKHLLGECACPGLVPRTCFMPSRRLGTLEALQTCPPMKK